MWEDHHACSRRTADRSGRPDQELRAVRPEVRGWPGPSPVGRRRLDDRGHQWWRRARRWSTAGLTSPTTQRRTDVRSGFRTQWLSTWVVAETEKHHPKGVDAGVHRDWRCARRAGFSPCAGGAYTSPRTRTWRTCSSPSRRCVPEHGFRSQCVTFEPSALNSGRTSPLW